MDLPKTVEWTGSAVRVLDQTLLPGELTYKDCHTLSEASEAIRALRVRGAPAIGVMAGYTLALAMKNDAPADRAAFLAGLESNMAAIDATRPTAHNLRWALDRCSRVVRDLPESAGPHDLQDRLLEEATRIDEEDRSLCDGIGDAGASLVPEGGGILTHCNAGALATAGIGTALAPLYRAWEMGRRFEVFADETRPLWQGSRLTAWELSRAGIPVRVLCDGASASLLASGKVDIVIVGTDRVAGNGDVANKIGTYGVALAARAHDIPFYVAAPSSTFDLSLKSGAEIPIEQRDGREVVQPGGRLLAPDGVEAWNPAFDVTPAQYVAGFITEKGIIRPPYERTLPDLFGE